MEENKVATDSSAPNAPELTRLSGEQAEERTAREGRAQEWLELQMKVAPFIRGAVASEPGHTTRFSDITCLLAKFAEIECSRLASRVEELENLIAKHSGCSHGNDSASGGTGNESATEIR